MIFVAIRGEGRRERSDQCLFLLRRKQTARGRCMALLLNICSEESRREIRTLFGLVNTTEAEEGVIMIMNGL